MKKAFCKDFKLLLWCIYGFCSSEMLYAGAYPGSREAARLQQTSPQIRI